MAASATAPRPADTRPTSLGTDFLTDSLEILSMRNLEKAGASRIDVVRRYAPPFGIATECRMARPGSRWAASHQFGPLRRVHDACDANATLGKFLRQVRGGTDLHAPLSRLVGSDSEVAMRSVSKVGPINENVAIKVRDLIAEHLGIDAKRVSNEAHFRKDLGADWLDRLELVIVIEDRFGVEIGDDVVDRIEAVGDLIRILEAQPLH